MRRLLLLIIATSAMVMAQLDRPTPLRAAPAQPASNVSAAGKVFPHFTAANDLVPFAFTIRNDSASELRDLRILNPPDGYELEQPSVDPAPVCDDFKSTKMDQFLVSKCLPAGQSVVARGNFRAISIHKAETLMVVLHWRSVIQTKALGANAQSGSEEKESSLAVDLGENEVQSWWRANVFDYLPIAVMPLAIAALTVLFNWRLARNGRRTEVLKQMLAGMQNYGSKFYMPISSAATGLADELKEDPETPQSFFFFLLLQRTMLDALAEIGGVFFSDQRGEVLASECWSRIFSLLYSDAGTEEGTPDRTGPFYLSAYAAAKVITPRSDYQEFSSRFVVQSKTLCLANPALERGWTEFKKSMGPKKPPETESEKPTKQSRVAALIVLLGAFSTVVDCEINRINKYWYPSVVPTPVDADVLEKLRELADFGKISRFRYFWPWTCEKWLKAFWDFWPALEAQEEENEK